MKTLVYIILGGMVLLLAASFFLPSCSPEMAGSNVAGTATPVVIRGGQDSVTVVSAIDGSATAGNIQKGQGLQEDKPVKFYVIETAQAARLTQTAVFTATLQMQSALAEVTGTAVAAHQAIESQQLEQLRSDPIRAQAMETQEGAAVSNQALAATRTVEVQAAATVEAFAPTATVQAAEFATAQVKAFAQATATLKAAKVELAAIKAQVAQAKESLSEMKSMGVATDGVSATLEALEAQARSKVEALERTQAQGWTPGGQPGYGPTGSTTYQVQPGDTWYSISSRFGVPVNELAAANGMSPYQNLWVGQVLVIPYHYPGPGPVPGPGAVYVVQPRDTMYSISRRFGVPLEELALLNGIVDYNRIWVGQKLIIPVPGPYPPMPPGPWAPTPIWPPGPTVWPPAPTPWPWTPTPPVPTGNDVYYSTDGKFSVQYPRAWQWGTDVPLGYVMFWTRETSDPFSVGFAIFSKPSSVWRPARDVLEDYKNDLSLHGLMNSLWGGVTFTWNGDVEPCTLGGQLSMGQFGNAQSNHVLAKATSRDDGSREYMALTWAPSNEWDVNQATLEALINTLAFTN